MGTELAKDNILVTTVYPGLMRTGSPPNALFKGQHAAEYAWFSVSDSLVISSIDARRAAQQVVEACRYGEAELTISIQALLASRFAPLFPKLTEALLRLTVRFLPGPTGQDGDRAQTGWQSQSAVSPSILTRTTDEAAVQNNQVPPSAAQV
jgi:NAD(P)-dependent dehydrogenase (short-subunit alcohol dehydrogenase family)